MESVAQIDLTKGAVARRQIDAAIRVWLSEEDDLAVYTVAAAAYGVLRGLMDVSGKPPSARFVAVGLFAYAQQTLQRQTLDCLPDAFGEVERKMIADIAELITTGQISTADDLSYTWDRLSENKRWSTYNRPANFLKHADRDAGGVLDAAQIDVEDLLLRACGTYVYIFNDSTLEMNIFWVFLQAAEEDTSQGPNTSLICDLRKHKVADRKAVCLDLLRQAKIDAPA